MPILVINAGSSSVKFGVFDRQTAEQRAAAAVDWTATPGGAELVVRPTNATEVRRPVDARTPGSAVRQAIRLLAELGQADIEAVGHRVVHGGTRFRQSVRVDGTVKEAIAELSELAPLHNPPALEALEAAEEALPRVPHVAVFDTAFFADLPPQAFVYPLPYEWYADWGVRRFGFHGISHAYCTGRAAELLRPGLRLVICHLGNGCSATAVRDGKAVATTMGFTPLEGLMMGTRSGSVDPGLLLSIQHQRGLSAAQLEDILNHRSGLRGVSGVSSDYRQVEAAADQGNERARLALTIYADRVRAAVGALAVTLGGVDALIFTAGVGENSARLRAATCTGLECLGLRLDAQKNAASRPDADVAEAGSPGRILAMHTREEALIAREAARLCR